MEVERHQGGRQRKGEEKEQGGRTIGGKSAGTEFEFRVPPFVYGGNLRKKGEEEKSLFLRVWHIDPPSFPPFAFLPALFNRRALTYLLTCRVLLLVPPCFSANYRQPCPKGEGAF